MIAIICIFSVLILADIIGFIISERADAKILKELLAMEKN